MYVLAARHAGCSIATNAASVLGLPQVLSQLFNNLSLPTLHLGCPPAIHDFQRMAPCLSDCLGQNLPVHPAAGLPAVASPGAGGPLYCLFWHCSATDGGWTDRTAYLRFKILVLADNLSTCRWTLLLERPADTNDAMNRFSHACQAFSRYRQQFYVCASALAEEQTCQGCWWGRSADE